MGLLLPLCRSYLSVVFGLIQQLFVCCQIDSFKSCLILFQFLARLFPIFPCFFFHAIFFHVFSFPLYMYTQPACASCVYMSCSIYMPVCRRYNQIHTFWVSSVLCRSMFCSSTAASLGSYPMHFTGLLGLPHFS